uniref:Protein kinase domain-containing protein n=1 Tax=Nelumbo nucifera TaxID=4432 RepID=A0A822ZV62_NELNU|nr:TPA_asm: hypothetical protein HUJ06_017348 [Nelumbo nucifera]
MLQVADLARLDHENTGKLLGYCRENNPFSRMLVFEYASNGTLYEHLHCKSALPHTPPPIQMEKLFTCNFLLLKYRVLNADGEESQLSWTRRMKIIIGIARGLRYLHTELEPPFSISELNSSSIYLTEDFSPKVCSKHF